MDNQELKKMFESSIVTLKDVLSYAPKESEYAETIKPGKFGKWKVSLNGDMEHVERGYFISCERLEEENWILHLNGKNWIDWNDFIPAYLQALRNKNIKRTKILIYY